MLTDNGRLKKVNIKFTLTGKQSFLGSNHLGVFARVYEVITTPHTNRKYPLNDFLKGSSGHILDVVRKLNEEFS